mmetsp:Transcript_73419/g.174950  ORF Transcript_73419/g.174950 Transcript_73419/m.174950 type:complete len:795 (+) Transcript_73419:101-2485(+)
MAENEELPQAGPPSLLGPQLQLDLEDEALGEPADAVPDGMLDVQEVPASADMRLEDLPEETYTPVYKIAPGNGSIGGKPIRAWRKDEPEIDNAEFVEFLQVEKNRWQNCASLPLITIIWIVFILVQWMHGEVGLMFNMRQCLYRAIDETEVHVPHASGGIVRNLTLSSLESAEDVWYWAAGGLVYTVSGQDGRPGYLRTYNQVIGDIALRQQRAAEGECKVDSTLAAHYDLRCLSRGEVSVDAYGPGLQEPQDPAFTVGGGLGLTDDTSKRFLAWLDVRTPQQGAAEAARLGGLHWIDDLTEQVKMHVAVFNAEIRAYALITVTLIFSEVGLAEKELDVKPLNADVYPKWWYAIPDIIWAVLMMKLTASTLQQVADSRAKSFFGRCFPDAWAMVEHFASLLGFCIIILFITMTTSLGSLAEKVGDFNPGNATITMEEQHERNSEIITELDQILGTRMLARLGMFWYVFILMMLFFKSFRGQPRLAIITETFTRGASDLLHFGLLAFVVVGNFALGGYVMFGSELQDWSTVYFALHSTLAMAYGRGDYAALYSIAPASAAIWLILYLVLFVFVMSNMLIAILSSYYGQVKSSLEDKGLNILKQGYIIADDAVWNWSYQLRRAYRIFKLTKLGKRFPDIREEPVRVSSLPYQAIIAGVNKIMYKPHKTSFKSVTEDFLQHCGCDEATAERLLKKYKAFRHRRGLEAFPMKDLFEEFEIVMADYYKQLDGMKDHIHDWYAERLVDFEKLAPRQRHLNELAESIVPEAGPPEDGPAGDDSAAILASQALSDVSEIPPP